MAAVNDQWDHASIHSLLSFSSFESAIFETPTRYDFISFLALAQKLHIDFIPVIYSDIEGVVAMDTYEMRQISVNETTSLIFKRTRSEAQEAFRSLTSEVAVLGHPSIRNHPNITQLQGISWDVLSDGNIWPAFVFEKSGFGDLALFASSAAGRNLNIQERLKICVDIGTAIKDLHSSRFVLGDIKPQNVLIYRDELGILTARVINFDFSARVVADTELIYLATSYPWTAPEFHHRGCRLSEAVKMDLYSFSLLCIWFLFDFSSGIAYSKNATWMEDFGIASGFDRSEYTLSRLKEDDKLALLAEQLLTNDNSLEQNTKEVLIQFLVSNLRSNPAEREIDFQQSFSLLTQQKEYPLQDRVDQEDLGNDFEIILSIRQLYEAHYQVRCHIFKCLEDRSQDGVAPEKTAFQLALCYEIGFGVPKNDELSAHMLLISGRSEEDLNNTINQMRVSETQGYQASLYKKLEGIGHIKHARSMSQRKIKKTHGDEHWLRREIGDLKSVTGSTVEVALLLASLSSIYCDEGRWEEAEIIETQVMELRLEADGEHPDTLDSMANLASIVLNQGRWKEAEALELQVAETRLRTMGEHADTLDSLTNLSSIFWSQGRRKKAMELVEQIIETRKRVLGERHYDTLVSMSNRASMARIQGQWNEAEVIFRKVLELRGGVLNSGVELGVDHLFTVTSMANLAFTLRAQGCFKDAETLEREVLDMRIRILEKKHPDTTAAMANLGSTLWNQGRWEEAEKLFLEAIEISKEILGTEHPVTITYTTNLASTLWSQGRRKEAEALLVQTKHLSQNEAV
ncbi:hypothetical protein BP6252_13853 [Coleophoma cylindrospora]|uniref:Protein kinase domain-containing protein n=1 Tax=Coleophoma cylindrospora TaxID=1849047 RepID=A0A3D8Q5Z7_9HELO|nr:hypothetical protein BP6252_13853 [Coleophoma cylindrospora]